MKTEVILTRLLWFVLAANYGKLWLRNRQWQGQILLDPQTMNLAVTYQNPVFLG